MSNTIRIAFFADILAENKDGAVRTIYNLIKRIPKDKFDVQFFSGEPPEQDFPFNITKVFSIKIPFNRDYSMVLPYVERKKLHKTLEIFRPDVIHITTPSPLGTFAMNYASKHNIPVITIYHTHFISYFSYYLKRLPGLADLIKNLALPSYKSFYNKCNLVYIPTNKMRDELCNLGLSGHNFRIWPRGINKTLFNPQKRNITKIREFTGNNKVNVLFSSRLVWEKNLMTLYKIYEEANRSCFQWNFIIAGDGMAKKELQQMMPQAYFTGHLDHDDLSVLYASSDIFLFTSVTETFGNVVLEAMASGLPCVIANGGGSAGLVEEGNNGFLCEPFTPKHYLSAINVILGSKAIRARIIESALEYSGKFEWENLVDIYSNDVKTLSSSQSAVFEENLYRPVMDLAY